MKRMSNSDVRTAAKEAGVFLYEIAAFIGISEPTMTRMLRFELPEGKKREIFSAITKLSAKKKAPFADL